MFFFPLCNFIALIVLYFVHKKAFIITTIIEVLLNGIGIYYIYTEFSTDYNRTLYLFALTGAGFIIAIFAFIIAISLNHKDLYSSHE